MPLKLDKEAAYFYFSRDLSRLKSEDRFMLTRKKALDKFPYRIYLFGWALNLNRMRGKNGSRTVGTISQRDEGWKGKKKSRRMKYLELESKEGFGLVW